jgi:P27 family predicted phage terminase small subunit
MARPTKSASVYNGKISKEEKKRRMEEETKLKGAADNVSPPKHLNARQKKIFSYIVDELQASGIIGNLDIYILGTCAISIDRLQQIEKMINKDIGNLRDKTLMSAKDKYTKDFFRCCNELSLSPQSRAKLGNINLQSKQQEEDPLLKLLAGGKN